MAGRGGFFAGIRDHLLDIRPMEDRRLLGISMFLGALVAFTGIDSSAKWLLNDGVGVGQAVFMRYGVHLALILGFLLPLLGRSLFRTRRPGLEILRALMLMISTAMNFAAVQYLSLSVTAAIFFTLPIILCAFSVPFLGEKVGWRRWVAIFVGFAGVLVIIRPGTQTFQWATLFSLGATTALAFYNILSRKLAGIDSIYTQQFYVALVASLFVLPFAIGPLASEPWVFPESPWSWGALFGMGVFGAIGHWLLTEAHRYAPASTLAPFVYGQIVPMTLSSWLIFGQLPDVWIWVGAPIVLASGLYIWIRERNRG